MIITEVFYGLKCNRCGELFEDGEHSFWNDESSAIENAYESDWAELKGKHYCPNCHEIDEETDEVKVYEEYPQHLKTLNGFIDRILHGTSRNVIEKDNDFFLIKCQFYQKPKLDLFEVEYIKSLLGDKFISLDYEEGKYNSFTCCIKFKKQMFRRLFGAMTANTQIYESFAKVQIF